MASPPKAPAPMPAKGLGLGLTPPMHCPSLDRNQSENRSPHSVSLKVLRLARPELSVQHVLPESALDSAYAGNSDASRAFPLAGSQGQNGAEGDGDQFVLTAGMKLPASFGTVHVGEGFVCTLVVSTDDTRSAGPATVAEGVSRAGEGEVAAAEDETKEKHAYIEVEDVSLYAELFLPSSTPDSPDAHNADNAPIVLDIETASAPEQSTGEQSNTTSGTVLKRGESKQHIIRAHLPEEGQYQLAVTVSYTEVSPPSQDSEEATKRMRTFKKVYRFAAEHAIRVRIRSRTLPPFVSRKFVGGGGEGRRCYSVEAQLEKLGAEDESALCIEGVELFTRTGLSVRSLNAWDTKQSKDPEGGSAGGMPLLTTNDVLQAAFLVFESEDMRDVDTRRQVKDGRLPLGQMRIRWRRAMGERGTLDTGVLSVKVG